jgi:hypothetical protein
MPFYRAFKYSTQESLADTKREAEILRENAKRCDYPPCNASAADKSMTALKKCPRCGEGRYCCKTHCNLDWDRHKLLCQDIKLKVRTYLEKRERASNRALVTTSFYCRRHQLSVLIIH